MKNGILVYEELFNKFNIGDYIQSLAAKQFLPSADVYINRENSANYTGENIKLIMNGWFTHTQTNEWIPSKNIDPLFVSFHLNNSSIPYMLTDEGINYLKSKEPIGCRDQFTADTLNKKGIKAYFSGCLTLTLDSYTSIEAEKDDKIYIVDPLYNYPTNDKIYRNYKTFLRGIQSGKIFKTSNIDKHLKKVFTQELLDEAEYITQVLPGNTYSIDEKFKIAEDLLHKYSKAKLVITSRIHCALPCLAMGTPVIYINGFDNFFDTCRFEGILNLFNRVDINSSTGEFTTNFNYEGIIGTDVKVNNLNHYLTISNNLKNTCKQFIKS